MATTGRRRPGVPGLVPWVPLMFWLAAGALAAAAMCQEGCSNNCSGAPAPLPRRHAPSGPPERCSMRWGGGTYDAEFAPGGLYRARLVARSPAERPVEFEGTWELRGGELHIRERCCSPGGGPSWQKYRVVLHAPWRGVVGPGEGSSGGLAFSLAAARGGKKGD